MKNFSTILLVMFMIMYWIYRIIVTLTAELAIDFLGIVPLDMTVEVVVLFVTIICVVLVVKRKLVGALMYLFTYGLYFGTDIIQKITVITSGKFTVEFALGFFVSLVGIAIPIAVLFDVLMDKNRKVHPVDKKTDWFYKNKEFDRNMDDRADKNNYRTL